MSRMFTKPSIFRLFFVAFMIASHHNFSIDFNYFRAPGLVPLDWIRKSVVSRCIYASGAPMWYLTDTGQPVGENELA